MGNKIDRAAFDLIEVAKYVGVSDKNGRKMLKEGVIQCVQYGGRTFIPKVEVDRFLRGGK